MTEDEEFYAWLDGELDEEGAARVAARVAADPALARLAAQHRTLGEGLRGAFAPVMADDVAPARVTAEVVDLGARRDSRRPNFGLPQWAAMAATLAIGLVAGQFVNEGSGATVESRDGVLVAAASLDQALGQQLASAGTDGSVRVGMTFRSRDGAICRSFSDVASSGLACRNGERWQVEGLFAAPSGPDTDYRMAAGEDPRLAALIENRIAGEPFDSVAEKAARDANWK
ncbi:MAG: anti-sigma factor [Sphingomicrobium sp.]